MSKFQPPLIATSKEDLPAGDSVAKKTGVAFPRLPFYRLPVLPIICNCPSANISFYAITRSGQHLLWGKILIFPQHLLTTTSYMWECSFVIILYWWRNNGSAMEFIGAGGEQPRNKIGMIQGNTILSNTLYSRYFFNSPAVASQAI